MKRFLSLLCVMCLLLAYAPLLVSNVAPTASAETTSDKATVPTGLAYQIIDGKAQITCYKGTATELVIPAAIENCPVTSIGMDAFCDCTSLTSITLPDSVTSIEDYAFSGCTSLASITIPDGLTSIGSYAFLSCSSLASITLPDGLTSIGSYAFTGCKSFTSITIPDGLTSIAHAAFYSCTSLASITIPDSVTSIGGSAFRGCTSLVSITLPDDVTSIGEFTFYECTSLANITLPHGVTSIKGWAFTGCTSLASITLPDSVTSIGYAAFSGCTSLADVYYGGSEGQWDAISVSSDNSPLLDTDIHFLWGGATTTTTTAATDTATTTTAPTLLFFPVGDSLSVATYRGTATQLIIPSVYLGKPVTSIEEYAFHGNKTLESIIVPDSVTVIGDGAFCECAVLKSVVIGSGVTYINGTTFSHSKMLQSVTIPESVTKIYGGAFYDCPSLTDVYFGGSEEQWNEVVVDISNDPLKKATVHFAKIHTGVKQIGEDLYYVNHDGSYKTGKFWVASINANGLVTAGYVYADATGRFYNKEFVTINGARVYMEKGQPTKNTGVREIDGNLYSLNHKGQVNIGKFWVTTAGTNGLITKGDVYTDETGRIYNNEIVTLDDGVTYYMRGGRPDKGEGGIREVNGNLYYVSWKGEVQVGTVYVSNPNGYSVKGFHYTDAAGCFYNDMFVRIHGTLCYMVNGRAYTDGGGVEKIHGDLYYISWKGEVQTGTVYVSNPNGYTVKGTHYTDENGRFYDGEFVTMNGKIHYMLNGRIHNTPGVIEVDGGLYYVTWEGFIATGEVYVTYTNGLVDNGGWHYADATGRFRDGEFITSSGKTYYVVKGAVYSAKGVLKVGEDFYYVSYNNSIVVNGKVNITATTCNGYEIAVGTYYTDDNGRIILW